MIFFDKTRTIGQDANGKNVVWVSVYVDTAANLPAYNDYQSDGFILCMASEGRCIDTGDLYLLDSAGTWQISQAGTGTYTKAEIDALLNAKQNTLTFDATPTQNSTNPVTSGGMWADQQRQDKLQSEDRAELVLNRHCGYLRTKNILDLTRVKALNPSATWNDNVMTLNGVDWKFNNDGTITVNGTADSNGSYPTLMNWKTLAHGSYMMTGGNYPVRFTAFQIGSDTGNGFQLTVDNATTQPISFIGNVSAGRVVNNITISPMLCTLDDYQASATFEPHSPSNFDLLLMILALQ